jgi:response regulator of citrate/malate metabolism
MSVRVLVVEDEPLVAQAHAEYVARVAGFEVVGVVHSAADALRHLAERGPVDLLLLDLNLPDGHGLALLRRLRGNGHLCDAIAVTAARDLAVVRSAVAHGVVLYLLKPFTFAMFRAKLEQYADYRSRLGSAPAEVVQDEVDRLLGALRVGAAPPSLPKGLSPERLQDVTDRLRTATDGLSASELGEQAGTSRVTARRYLEHLADAEMVERSLRYRGSGRPEVEYVWRRVVPPVVTRPR